jgi:hypothetical protein
VGTAAFGCAAEIHGGATNAQAVVSCSYSFAAVMYTLDRLFDDLAKSRGHAYKSKSDCEKVWDAFNRYITTTLDKRQTLNVAIFCKIGWKIEEFQGKPRLRPHFHLADSFTRVFNLDAKSHPAISERFLTSVEEFNFSKAAINFSQSLTKDQIFMGLRAIIHRIGEAAAREQVVIDFEVGQLHIKDRDVQFSFVADLYLREGLEVPEGAREAADYKPSVTFGPPSQDALTLSLKGTNQYSGNSASARTVKADHLGGFRDEELSPRSAITNEGTSARITARSDHASECSDEAGRRYAQEEALNRHIGKMEEEAAKVIAEKHLWEGHLQRCCDLEQRNAEWRKALAKQHQEHLKNQMRDDEERRAQMSVDHITQANMHSFPDFKEPADIGVREYLHDRRENLKQDLDQQCELKERMRQKAKQRELELELVNIQAGQADIEKLARERRDKRDAERAVLKEAWGQDVRLKAVKKAIEDHHMTRLPKHELHGLVSSMSSEVATTSPGRIATPRFEPAGALSDRSSTASSRMSGSARRMPLGAAASLALQKERLKVKLQD